MRVCEGDADWRRARLGAAAAGILWGRGARGMLGFPQDSVFQYVDCMCTHTHTHRFNRTERRTHLILGFESGAIALAVLGRRELYANWRTQSKKLV